MLIHERFESLGDDRVAPDLSNVWPDDPAGDAFTAHKWHSGQFRMNNMKQRGYWSRVRSEMGL